MIEKLGEEKSMVTTFPKPPPHEYMECLKNHAAAIGGSATDGCGEFMAGGEEGTLEALKCAACTCHQNFHRKIPQRGGGGAKKRFRSKFTKGQKEKMTRFAHKIGWKIYNADEVELRSFCQEVGVNKKVLKVWMHNNKYNHLPTATATATATATPNT
ncbi:zinc-finger homeodomain protein 4-like [Salvia divinorum]|uniref:Zinc-finger homeodomain protein 4-like n=1 Tax=Salvia divinorum TaxID=28513 RepID=A0ABD1FXJ9_SALDI